MSMSRGSQEEGGHKSKYVGEEQETGTWAGHIDATVCKGGGKRGERERRDLAGTWVKVQIDVRVCIYLGQLGGMRTSGGKVQASPGEVRSCPIRPWKGRSGLAGGEERKGRARQGKTR